MARLEPEYKTELSEEDIAAIIAIADRQAELKGQLRAALEACDDLRALEVARELVGIEREIRNQ